MRRRGFRGLRPLHRLRRGFSPDIPPALQRANDLMASGDYPAAAAAFEKLAQGAEARHGPRAPHLYLRAGHACLLNAQVPLAMGHFEHGLSLLAASGHLRVLQRAGWRVVQQLKERGLDQEAQQIEARLNSLLPAGFTTEAPATGGRVTLPTHCPGCGGPVRPDEVAWLDESTAECSYCGSPIRGG
jgi:hypothetical protein